MILLCILSETFLGETYTKKYKRLKIAYPHPFFSVESVTFYDMVLSEKYHDRYIGY